MRRCRVRLKIRGGLADFIGALDVVLATDAFDRHLTRPFLQRMQLLRERVADGIDELGRNAQLDQYPARRVPQIYTRRFGPITGPIVARNDPSDEGNPQERNGTLATPGAFILPMNGNIYIGRDGRFTWCRSAVHAHMSLTWKSDPGDLPTAVKAWATRQGDLFDDVVAGNGGGLLMDQFAYVPIALSDPSVASSRAFCTFAWRMGLYDKKRDRNLHDGESLPSSYFAGGLVDDKQTALRHRFDESTELEPRLYVDELSSILNFTTTDLTDMTWKVWLTFSMIGFLEQNQDRGRGRDADGDGREF